jgi:hypothetical protein
MANAFACRSASVSPGRLGWTTNRLLLSAVGAELVALATFVLVPSVADLLEHTMPPLAAVAVALSTAPAVLAADALHKARRRTKSRNSVTFAPAGRGQGGARSDHGWN